MAMICRHAFMFISNFVWQACMISSFWVLFKSFSTNLPEIYGHCWWISVFCRSHLVAKLIFLDQLSEISPFLPRTSLEPYVPYAILRSIYSQYYSNSPSIPFALLSASPHHSPAISLTHASPISRQPRGDSTPQNSAYDSGYFRGSSSLSQEHLYETESGNLKSDNKHRNVRRSGPLDYSSSRKVKYVEGSTSGNTGPSPLPRFAVSRSGPISYK